MNEQDLQSFFDDINTCLGDTVKKVLPDSNAPGEMKMELKGSIGAARLISLVKKGIRANWITFMDEHKI
jgi:hypothetical protein